MIILLNFSNNENACKNNHLAKKTCAISKNTIYESLQTHSGLIQ